MAMRLTKKQKEIIRVIAKGDTDPAIISMKKLADNLYYQPTRLALHCSIKFLEKHGLVKTVRMDLIDGHNNRIISLTELGFQFANFLRSGMADVRPK